MQDWEASRAETEGAELFPQPASGADRRINGNIILKHFAMIYYPSLPRIYNISWIKKV